MSRTVGTAYLALASIIALAQLTAIIRQVPTSYVVRDIVEVTGASVYTGFLSQMGLFVWSAASAVCLFAYFAIRRESSSLEASFLRASFLVTTGLLLSDAFTLHDRLIPFLFGVSPAGVYAVYGLTITAFVWRYESVIRAAPYALLAIAMVLGAGAGLIDVLDHRNANVLAETAMKFLAIGSWLMYFGQICLHLIQRTHLEPDGHRTAPKLPRGRL